MKMTSLDFQNFQPMLSAVFTNVASTSADGWPINCYALLGILFNLSNVPAAVLSLSDEVRSIKLAVNNLPLMPQAASTSTSDGWLDSSQAANYLQLSKTTFEKHVYKGNPKIKGYLVGGKNLYKQSDLDKWVMTWRDKSRGYL